jgi:CubicO group peptidase (beta-lactamase class C family)
MKTYCLFICLLLLLCCCSEKEPEPQSKTYFPPITGTTWETATPASLDWNEPEIPALLDFLNTTNTRAFIILYDGRIIIEYYNGKQFDNITNFSVNSNWYWASAGKTLTAAVVGIAEADGLLDLDDATSAYLGTGWTNLSPTQENQITISHQLTMTTGLDDGVADPDCTEKACLVFKAAPGTRWAYHNAPYTLLDGVIENATGKSLNTFAQEKIFTPIGMTGLYIVSDFNNIFYSNARSMARFGLLLLNDGRWNDDIIIPEDYVALMKATSQNLNRSYGYLTWLNGKASSMAPGLQTVFPVSLTPEAPADMFAAMGKNGQLINVVPSKKLVIIRLGDAPDSASVPFTFQIDLWEKLNAVIP